MKLELTDTPSKPSKREYKFSDLSLHSGMFKGITKDTEFARGEITSVKKV